MMFRGLRQVCVTVALPAAITVAMLGRACAAGVSHSWGRAALALDYLHAKAEFGGTIQDGYALSGTIPVMKAVAVKLTVGTTVSNSAGAPYGSLYVSIDL
jgi:hypothetical protein